MPPAESADRHSIERGEGPLYLQIAERLECEIRSGTYPVGHRFPPEPALAELFGVSRLTLRQALGVLEHRGLIDRIVGRQGGTFVRPVPVERDLTTFAGFTEHMRRSGVVAGARLCERSRVPADPAVAEALELEESTEVLMLERVRLADGTPVAVEQSWFREDDFPGLLDKDLEGALYEMLESEYARVPTHAREMLEPVNADEHAAELLGVPVGTALLLVERTAYDAEGRPVEFSRDMFLGDRTRVLVWSFEVAGGEHPHRG